MSEAILTTYSRPVRLLSVAASETDFTNALELYTHKWGGAADAILPFPTSGQEESRFKRSLSSFNPDLVVLHEDVPADWKDQVDEWTPSPIRSLTAGDVREFSAGGRWMRLSGGAIPHIVAVLNDAVPNFISEDINVRIPDRYYHGLDLTKLYFGVPSSIYTSFLKDQLFAKPIKITGHQQSDVGVWLASRYLSTPWRLTLQNVTRAPSHQLMVGGRTALEDMRLDSERSLQLFVHNGESLHVPCAYWNATRVNQRTNKLIISPEGIISVLELLLDKYSSSGGPHELILFVHSSKQSAAGVYGRVQRALNRVEPNLPVAVYHQGFGFFEGRGTARWRVAYTESKIAGERNDVRFTPQAPVGHRTGKRVYGFDSEVEVESGRKYSLPPTGISRVLLSNSRDRIAAARERRGGLTWPWLNQAPAIRPASEGIAGTLRVGAECRVHLHPPDYVVKQQLLERGCRMRPSPHTRYARGIVRRLGSLSTAIGLVRKDGALVLKSLVHAVRQQTTTTGLLWDALAGRISRDWKIDHGDARELLEEHLPKLLDAGLVRRGVSVPCPDCRLSGWHSLAELDEWVECPGCTHQFILPDESTVEYYLVPNELAARFISEGGRAVLMTAGVLRQLDRSAIVQFGGFLTRSGEDDPFGEVDLISLSYRRIVVAECKDFFSVTEDKIAEVVDSLRSTLDTAREIDADHVVLGLCVDGDPDELVERLLTQQENMGGDDAPFDIILNNEIWVSEEEGFMEPNKVSFDEEVSTTSESDNRIGSMAHSIGFGGEGSWIERDSLQSVIKDRTVSRIGD